MTFTTESFYNGRIVLHAGDCREVVKTLPPNSLDSLVSDTPYALTSIVKRFGQDGAAPAQEGADGRYNRLSRGFMGHRWDTGEVAHDPAFWREWYRVLKPGAHIAVMGGTRTFHRLATAVEDAGFEVRDAVLNVIDPDAPVVAFMESLSEEQLRLFVRCMDDQQFGGLFAWMYATGFPKSHDLAKGIDGHRFKEWLDADPARRAGYRDEMRATKRFRNPQRRSDAKAAVDEKWRALGGFDQMGGEAFQWQGWGTALKPAFEPICIARKPLGEDTVAANVLRWRTGALNIDSCRVGDFDHDAYVADLIDEATRQGEASAERRYTENGGTTFSLLPGPRGGSVKGRWPANVTTDGSEVVADMFPITSSGALLPHHKAAESENNAMSGKNYANRIRGSFGGDSGNAAARFYYSTKANKSDRAGSTHPTIKPVGLKQWLVRLTTPPGGITADPFAGTGTTGEAAVREGMRCIMVEREESYREDIRRRMTMVFMGPEERARASIAPEPVEVLPLWKVPQRPAGAPTEPRLTSALANEGKKINTPSEPAPALAPVFPSGRSSSELLSRLRSGMRRLPVPRIME